MADKQLLLKKNDDDGFFADDDPLAELARIVGFEPSTDSQTRAVTVRREPEFDLEDELLKEFEQYEAPERAEPVEALAPSFPVQTPVPQPVAVEPEQFAVEPEPLAFEPQPRPEPEPVFEPVAQVFQPRPVETLTAAPVFVDPARPASHPVFELEDEILREFASFDARRTGQVQPELKAESQPQSADLVDQLIAELSPLREESAYHEPEYHPSLDSEPVAETAHEVDTARREEREDRLFAEQWHEANDDVFEGDLASAIEPDADDLDELIEEPVHLEADFSAEQGWDDSIAVDTSEDEAPAVEPEAKPAPEVVYFGIQPVSADEATSPAQEHVIAAAVPAEPAYKPIPARDVNADKDFGLDALLDDTSRYPIGGPTVQWPRSTPTLAEPKVFGEPKVLAEPQVVVEPKVYAEPVAEVPEKVFVREQPVEVTPPEVASVVPAIEPLIARAPVIDEKPPVAESELPEILEAFDDGAFELDLSEIELDLLEVETFDDDVARQEAVSVSPASLSAIAEASVEQKPVPVAEKASQPTAEAIRPAEDYSTLPFDPTQISSDEEPVEAIADMDVPEILQEQVNQPPPRADYDIDIDAEMAHLFNRSSTAAPGRSSAAQAVAAASSRPAAAAPQPMLPSDLDDFERALEEDFRKSMTENRAVSTPDRVALSPGGFPIENNARSSNRRFMVLAASVAAIVLLGGAGVYAFIGGESAMQTATEPKIILADKDPVKVVPEDKGGQTVPNQDKAVYDRVSGDKTEVGKQERLVTSNEEPIDVVQKTLMPENLPMDDEDGANVAPTDDPADARLAAEDAGKDNMSTSEKVASGVAPRKVRTMVVRADGTLVPREEMAEEEPTAKTSSDQSQTAEKPVEVAKTDPVVPERLSESASDSIASEINAAEPAVQEKAAEPVAEKPAVTEEQLAATDNSAVVSEDLPAPAEDSASKSIATKPAVADDTTASTEDVSSADTQSALADAANAEVDAPVRPVKTTTIASENMPIPENRPVEQPVNVVGTVTDQGNVKKAAEPKVQEVASAEPVGQPEKATAVPAGSYVIQIASLPSEAEAQSSYTKLSSKFSGVIGGMGVDIKRAEIKNKGTYYRVRIPVGTKQEAASLCDRYKKAGGSCLVSK